MNGDLVLLTILEPTSPGATEAQRLVESREGEGFIGPERDHLHLLDLVTRRVELLTPGPYDEMSRSWSPDGRSIAFVSRRRPEYDRADNWDLYVIAASPGSEPRQLTTFQGADICWRTAGSTTWPGCRSKAARWSAW